MLKNILRIELIVKIFRNLKKQHKSNIKKKLRGNAIESAELDLDWKQQRQELERNVEKNRWNFPGSSELNTNACNLHVQYPGKLGGTFGYLVSLASKFNVMAMPSW